MIRHLRAGVALAAVLSLSAPSFAQAIGLPHLPHLPKMGGDSAGPGFQSSLRPESGRRPSRT